MDAQQISDYLLEEMNRLVLEQCRETPGGCLVWVGLVKNDRPYVPHFGDIVRKITQHRYPDEDTYWTPYQTCGNPCCFSEEHLVPREADFVPEEDE